MDTDTTIRDMGGCGLFQVLLMFALYSAKVLSAWGIMFMAFGNYNPGWKCVDHADLSLNATNLQGLGAYDLAGNGTRMSASVARILRAISPALSAINSTVANITEADEELGNSNVTKGPKGDQCEIIKSCKSIEFESGASTIVTEWGLVCDRTWITSLIISIQMVGGLLGSLIAGQLSDSLGRKFGLYSTIAVSIVTNVAAIFSVNWQMFAAIRFFVGMSAGGMIAAGHSYPLEFVGSDWRAILTAMPDWNVGTASFAVCAWFLRDWKNIHIATAVASTICFLPVFWVPESMRWLAVNDKVAKAKKVAVRMCKFNRKPPPNTKFLEDIAKQEEESNKDKKRYTYLSLFVPSLRRKTITFVLLYVIMAIVYYAVNFGVKALSGDFYLNLILFSVTPFPFLLICPILANRLGRRWAINIFMMTSIVVTFGVVVAFFVTSGEARGIAITVLALLTAVCLDAGWMLSSIFIVEHFPTVVRTMGFGAATMGARIGSIIAPYLIPRSFDYLYIPYLVMGGLMVATVFMVFSLAETNRMSLEESIILAPPANNGKVVVADDMETDNDGLLHSSDSRKEEV